MPPETVSIETVPLRERICKLLTCQKIFYICRRCDRGQVYCSPQCRGAARKEQHRKAAAKYQATRKGRRRHADRERARRERRRARAENKVTDPPFPAADTASSFLCDDARPVPQTRLQPLSSVPPSPQPIPPPGLRCQFCGCPGYLPKRDADEPHHPARNP
jgi:hypothetical protein